MPTTSDVSDQDGLYERAAAEYGAALVRLARGYEADPDKRRDLLQEIHLALWRSFNGFHGECSLRTWAYRVAHNVATSWVIRQRRARPQMLLSLEDAEPLQIEPNSDRHLALARLMDLIHRLKPVDRQIILSYLDGMDAGEIAELTGLSPGNVATKVHRIKNILARDFQGRAMDELRNLWQNQEVEEMKMSIEELRAKAAKFQKRIQLRNVREYVACAFVIPSFGWAFIHIPQLVPRISFGLIIAGAVYVVWYLHTRGAVASLPSDMGRENCVTFHRRELERQRDLLRNIWKWYLGPLIPGLALYVIWSIIIAPPARRRFLEAYAVFCVALFWGIGWLNRRGARRLDRQIDELKTPDSQPFDSDPPAAQLPPPVPPAR